MDIAIKLCIQDICLQNKEEKVMGHYCYPPPSPLYPTDLLMELLSVISESDHVLLNVFFQGIRAVAECLAKSNSEETQDCARNLLQQLSSVSNFQFLCS